MSHPIELNRPSDPLDELVNKLLESGGVFSQMISHMLAAERSQDCSGELAPVPEVAHSLVRSVIGDLGKRYSRRDIRVAARLVDDVTNAVCEDIFLYSPGDEP